MKKTKFLTRLGAVVFALAILVAMAVPALGATNTYTGTNQDEATSFAGTTSIPFTKSIVIFNTNNEDVREPDISFSYAVTSFNPEGATVNDGTNTVTVAPGPANGVTGTALAFSPSREHEAKTTGSEVEVSGSLTVDLTKFNHAGVFRYLITETPSVDVTTRGLEARVTSGTDAYDNTRYLDVYIYNPDATHSQRYMAGAVIFKSVGTGNNAGKDNINSTSFEKTTGFEPATEPGGTTTDYTNDTTVDRYFTYNLVVTKEITGNLADKTHPFPFEIAITGSLANAVTVDVDNNGTASTQSVSTTVLNQTAALANEDTYTVVGLPKGTTVTVNEYNDTVDTYKLTTTLVGTTSTSTKNAVQMVSDTAKANAFGETGVLINSGDATNVIATQNTEITFTNDISDISPTGLVFRVAPYVLMLAAGVSLIVLFAKRRREITDMI